MATPRAASKVVESSVLLIVQDDIDKSFVQRGAAVASMLGVELEVYCPVVMPPAPHSWMTRAVPPAAGQHRAARERGRRVAGGVMALLHEKEIGAHVEAGVSASATEAIVSAAARIEPTVLMYQKPDQERLLDQPRIVDHEAIWTRLDTATWIADRRAPRGDAIVGIVALGSRPRLTRSEDERVARIVARLAECAHADAHLIACVKRLPTLGMAAEVMATADAHAGSDHFDAMRAHLRALAEHTGIPKENVGLHYGSESDVLADLIRPLAAGLIVASGFQRRLLGGLVRKYDARKLMSLECDLLVLGESGFI